MGREPMLREPRDYYDADPPEGPDWAVLEERFCGECRAAYGFCPYRHVEDCDKLKDRLRELGEKARADRESAEESAAERRRED